MVEGGGAEIVVQPSFYGLDFDTKQTAVGLVLAYSERENDGDFVMLRDSRTNKVVGGMSSIVLEEGPAGWRIVGGHTSSSRPNGR